MLKNTQIRASFSGPSFKNTESLLFLLFQTKNGIECCAEYVYWFSATNIKDQFHNRLFHVKSHFCTHTITILNLRETTENENYWQAITSILLANKHHLELLRLDLFNNDERGHLFLPPNLKYLRVWCFEYSNNTNTASMVTEMAAEQCPKLCGLELYSEVTFRTVDAISRFEKFVAYLTIWTKNKIIICFSLTFLGFRLYSNYGEDYYYDLQEALCAMFCSGSLRHLQGLVITSLKNFEVLFIISFSGKLDDTMALILLSHIFSIAIMSIFLEWKEIIDFRVLFLLFIIYHLLHFCFKDRRLRIQRVSAAWVHSFEYSTLEKSAARQFNLAFKSLSSALPVHQHGLHPQSAKNTVKAEKELSSFAWRDSWTRTFRG